MQVVSAHPGCLNRCSSSVKGLGGTVMMMTAAYGEVELLQELLLLSQSNEVININTQTSRVGLLCTLLLFASTMAEVMMMTSSCRWCRCF